VNNRKQQAKAVPCNGRQLKVQERMDDARHLWVL
jgi:hypothetical protein